MTAITSIISKGIKMHHFPKEDVNLIINLLLQLTLRMLPLAVCSDKFVLPWTLNALIKTTKMLICFNWYLWLTRKWSRIIWYAYLEWFQMCFRAANKYRLLQSPLYFTILRNLKTVKTVFEYSDLIMNSEIAFWGILI